MASIVKTKMGTVLSERGHSPQDEEEVDGDQEGEASGEGNSSHLLSIPERVDLWHLLTKELQEDILSRLLLQLPDIFRLRCVCDTWRSFFSSPPPSFLTLLDSHNPPSASMSRAEEEEYWVAMARYDDPWLCEISFLELSSGRSLQPHFQYRNLEIDYFSCFACTDSGLLAFYTSSEYVLILNPLTSFSSQVKLDPPNMFISSMALLAAAPSSNINDFTLFLFDRPKYFVSYSSQTSVWRRLRYPPNPKHVCVTSLSSDNEGRLFVGLIDFSAVFVYHVKENTWIKVQVPFPMFRYQNGEIGMFERSPKLGCAGRELILVSALPLDNNRSEESDGAIIWKLEEEVDNHSTSTEQRKQRKGRWVETSRTNLKLWQGAYRGPMTFNILSLKDRMICISGVLIGTMTKSKCAFISPLVYDMESNVWHQPEGGNGYHFVSPMHPRLAFVLPNIFCK